MRRIFLLCLALGTVRLPVDASFDLGANFNERLDAARLPALDAGSTKWIRGFLPAFEFIDGDRSLATDAPLATFREAAASGRKVALTIKWDFIKSRVRVPAPDSERERACFEWAVEVVRHGRPDLFLLVNEIFIDTTEADTLPGGDGGIPIVRFLQRLARHVAAANLRTPDGLSLPVSCGGFTKLFTAEMQRQPAVVALLPWLASSPDITHVNFHIHAESLDEFSTSLAFMRKDVPARPFIVTEFSLVWGNTGRTSGIAWESTRRARLLPGILGGLRP